MHKQKTDTLHDPSVKHFYARIADGWLPIPPDMQTLLGWKDGDEVELVAIYGNQIVIRRKGALQNG